MESLAAKLDSAQNDNGIHDVPTVERERSALEDLTLLMPKLDKLVDQVSAEQADIAALQTAQTSSTSACQVLKAAAATRAPSRRPSALPASSPPAPRP